MSSARLGSNTDVKLNLTKAPRGALRREGEHSASGCFMWRRLRDSGGCPPPLDLPRHVAAAIQLDIRHTGRVLEGGRSAIHRGGHLALQVFVMV